jgi:Protein of unknown function DUF262
MEYKIESWSLEKLILLYEGNKLNLNPPYQRNDIWPPSAKKKLIESIKIGYPLPAFFLHQKNEGFYDMVDGQQRTRTFIGFQKKLFNDFEKKSFSEDDELLYKEYQICVCIISNVEEYGLIEDFYFRVNKFGIKLNRPEIKRSEFANSGFQKLVEQISQASEFERLDLFSQKSIERLNDQDFVAELLTLLHYGITDKKISVDRLYEDTTITQADLNLIKLSFEKILERIIKLNTIYPIKDTRYKQKNDFYTLISFLNKYSDDLSDEVLEYQYKLLVLIDSDIYPTNDKCWSFQEYANNCVSQSNSKRAREERLTFFEKLLLNTNSTLEPTLRPPTPNEVIADAVLLYGIEGLPLKKVEIHFLIDNNALNSIKSSIQFH